LWGKLLFGYDYSRFILRQVVLKTNEHRRKFLKKIIDKKNLYETKTECDCLLTTKCKN
jgi:hypothetical protein